MNNWKTSPICNTNEVGRRIGTSDYGEDEDDLGKLRSSDHGVSIHHDRYRNSIKNHFDISTQSYLGSQKNIQQLLYRGFEDIDDEDMAKGGFGSPIDDYEDDFSFEEDYQMAQAAIADNSHETLSTYDSTQPTRTLPMLAPVNEDFLSWSSRYSIGNTKTNDESSILSSFYSESSLVTMQRRTSYTDVSVEKLSSYY